MIEGIPKKYHTITQIYSDLIRIESNKMKWNETTNNSLTKQIPSDGDEEFQIRLRTEEE